MCMHCILSNSLSNWPHRHYCYILGLMIASFFIVEKTSNKLQELLYNVHNDAKFEPVQVCQQDKSG